LPSAGASYNCNKEGVDYELCIANARIAKFSDMPNHLYAVRLIGYKGTHELFADSLEKQATLFNSLKEYCTRFYLTNDYNVIKLLGKGNFSRVKM
jgi:hypothetical protein